MYWFYGEVALQALTLVVLVMLSLGSLGIPDAFRKARLPLSIFLFFVVSQLTIHHWPGVQWSADQSATNAQLIKSICLFEVFCLTLLLITNEQRFTWLVVTLLIAGTFQAIYGTLMTVTGTD